MASAATLVLSDFVSSRCHRRRPCPLVFPNLNMSTSSYQESTASKRLNLTYILQAVIQSLLFPSDGYKHTIVCFLLFI
jgi:hypothetical protein